MTTYTIARPKKLRGELIAPGDKSVSHRASIFNAIARGAGQVTNYAPGEDCEATINVLRLLGVKIERYTSKGTGGDTVLVHGQGNSGLSEPPDMLDAGESGTTMRLMSGVLAGHSFLAVLTGAEQLRNRPMGRIVEPLTAMGAVIHGRKGVIDGKPDTLAPLVFAGGALVGISYRMPVASAQLKSSILLAGLRAKGETAIHEPAPSRDHTERMLSAMGADITSKGLSVTVRPGGLRAIDVQVPGDTSSAAFWMVAAAIHPDAELCIRNVGINPTRAGAIEVLKAMGADISVDDERDAAGEPAADITVRSSRLRGTTIAGKIIPALIDEVPVLAVAAAMAEGETRIRDARELIVKESNRLAATVDWLTSAGVSAEAHADGMSIDGKGVLKGGEFSSRGDHRLAMSLAVAGLVSDTTVRVTNGEAAGKSYPGFWDDLRRVGGLAE